MQVAVVGGGLAGLTAAHALLSAGARVTLFESAPSLGGQIRTARVNGWLLEDGAEGFPAGRETVSALCEELGLGGRMLDQETRRTLRLEGHRLLPLAPGEAAKALGMQVEARDLGGGLRTLRDGMGTLVAALADQVQERGTVHLGSAVTRLVPGARPYVRCRAAPPMGADAVILALPPGPAAALLKPLVGASPPLSNIRLVSGVSVSLALPRTAVGHPLDATGFVGAGGANGFLACTFITSKFAGRAAKDWCLLRAFFRARGRDRDLPDAGWVQRAVRVLTPVLRIGAPPAHARVARWPHALPRFGPAHAAGVARLRERLLAHPWLDLAGAAVDGGGVDGAIRSGRAAAARLLQRIPAA